MIKNIKKASYIIPVTYEATTSEFRIRMIICSLCDFLFKNSNLNEGEWINEFKI